MDSQMYKKRAGTSGIQGHLYETKLISLIYFRLIHDDSVEQFSLATNRDDVGAFDDICFIANIKGFEKPLAVFLQAKHRENDKLLTFTSKTDLMKYFNSYLEIRRAFKQNNKDVFFRGQFHETECIFVMYTTAKEDSNHKVYEGTFADYLNELIGTAGYCTQPSYTDDDLDMLCKIVMKEQIITLAKQLVKFICDESDSIMSMNNDIMLRYHVILALNVFDVSEIQPEGHRIANFREDFFTTNDVFIVLIKKILCLEVLNKKNSEETDVQTWLKFLREPSDVKTLSKLLIGSTLKYKNDKIEFIRKSITDDIKQQLDKANVPQSTVHEAAELAAKEYLLSLKLKVPVFFGNKDLAIRGNEKKIKKRLIYLTTKIQEIVEQSKPNHIITIDESLEEGLLQLNGGIASAVGNILVLDETSKLLKFTDTCESLDKLAKTWYETLNNKIPNLHEYKLDIKVNNFAKLSFERGRFDEDLVRDFYKKLVFYKNQADQNRVEEILRAEIENHPCNDVENFKDRSGLIFLEYHDKIQKLWIAPKVGQYLTKKNKIYEDAVTYAMSQPLRSVLKDMLYNKNQDFTFNDDGMKEFVFRGKILGTIIASDSCVLTVDKVKQYLGYKDYIVLDIENIFKLPLKTHNTLCEELTNAAKEKIFIIVCDLSQDFSTSCKRLETIAKAVDGKQIIVITNKISCDMMIKFFSQANDVWKDERSDFTDLTVKSQKKFLATFKIKFQDEDVSLDTIVDVKHELTQNRCEFTNYVIFHKLINNETVKVGNKNWYSDYEKQFYVDRRVSRGKTRKHSKDEVLKTLYDLEDDLVLITAERRMGKSTLLSHLILITKELDPKAWIVRINIQKYEIILGTKYLLHVNWNIFELIKQIAVGDENESIIDHIKERMESPNNFFIVKSSHERYLELFQEDIFLDYYRKGKLIVVFEGFDEMNPKYKIVFGKWLKEAKSRGIKNKIWITSSSSSKLEKWFGPSYKLENFSHLEQEIYLKKIWKFRIQFKNLNTKVILNIEDFVGYMHIRKSKSEYLRVYVIFLEYLNMECLDRSIDFPYFEYYKHFMARFGLSISTIPYIPEDTTPEFLYDLAKEISVITVKAWTECAK